MTSLQKTIQTIVLSAFLPAVALAWGEKGHSHVSTAATHGLPAELPPFFHDAYPALIYYGYDPDRDQGEGRAAYAADFADHFVDLEYTEGAPFPQHRFLFLDALIRRGSMRRFGLHSGEVGFLPYRIAELSQQLEQQWWLWKRSDPRDRVHIERSIVRLAGLLGHFVGDAGNPHHTTVHYNGWLGANPRGYANDCAIHSRFESHFVNRAIDFEPVVEQLAPLRPHKGYFEPAMDLIRESHSRVEPLYELDRQGAFDDRGTADSRRFAAARMAAAASLLRDLWVSTYRNGIARP